MKKIWVFFFLFLMFAYASNAAVLRSILAPLNPDVPSLTNNDSCIWPPHGDVDLNWYRGNAVSGHLMDAISPDGHSYVEERLLCYQGRWFAADRGWEYWIYEDRNVGSRNNQLADWGIIIAARNDEMGGWVIVNDAFWGKKWIKPENQHGKVWYVRPLDSTVYGDENGLSYSNAWNGLKNVVWGDNGVKAGDTLYVCGLHVYKTNTMANIANQANIIINETGTQDNPLTIRMDCPNDKGIVWGVFQDNSKSITWTGPDSNGVYSTRDLRYGGVVEFNGSEYIWLNKMNSPSWVNHPGSYFSVPKKDQEWLTDITYVKTGDGRSPGGKIFSPSYGYTFDLAGNSYINFYKCNLYGSVMRKNRPRDFPLTEISHHITIDNCDIKYSLDYGALFLLYKGNDYWAIKNSELSYATNAIYTKTLDGVPGARFLTVDNNYIHDIGTPNFVDQDAHAIGIQGGQGHIIQNNVIENSGSAIEFWSSRDSMFNMTVRYNFIKNIRVMSTTGGSGIVISGDSVATEGKRKDFKIHHNIIMNTGIGAKEPDWQGAGISSNNIDPVEIYNNVLYNTTLGIKLSPNAGSVSGEVYNNIIINPKTGVYAKITRRDSLSTLQWDYNLYYPANNLDGLDLKDIHSILANPLFAAPQPQNAQDFQLRPNSPAINKGKDVGLLRDFNDISIPQQSKPDIGAFEFG